MIITALGALQCAGCATGAAGVLLVALNNKNSGFGFVLFQVSNGFWFALGTETGGPGLNAAQVIFTAISLIEIYRCLVAVAASIQQSPRKTFKEG